MNKQMVRIAAVLFAVVAVILAGCVSHADRGYAYSYEKDYDRAIVEYTKAIRWNPKIASRYYNRGNAYLNKKDYDRAIADYTEVIRLNPGYVDAYNNRGIAYKNKGEYDLAISDYKQAIEHCVIGSKVMYYQNLSNAYRAKGDTATALSYQNATTQLEHDYSVTANPEIAFQRGIRAAKQGDYDTALYEFTAIVNRFHTPYYDSMRAGAYYNMGIVYYNKGDIDASISSYSATISLDRTYLAAYYNRGIAYKSKKDYVNARADWEQVLRLDPNDKDALSSLELLQQMGY